MAIVLAVEVESADDQRGAVEPRDLACEPGGAGVGCAGRAGGDGDRTYDRCVAICRLEGADISETLVRQGLARDCPRFSGGRYREIEQAAVNAGATIRQIYRLPGYCER